MLYDVVVTKGVENHTFRNGISKGDAKKLVKELRKQGWKAQLVTCKGIKETFSIEPQNSDEDDYSLEA